MEALPSFISAPDPDHPGWDSWELRDTTRYNAFLGKMLVRAQDDGRARTRMFPGLQHSNLSNALHGGTAMGFLDISLFAAARVFGLLDPGPAVTLDLSVQFIGGGKIDQALDCEVELLKETGRLLFLRGRLLQDGDAHLVCAFSGTIRKPSKPRA
jgi:acyl-coenzyme A thioesterase PaaI-like protein